jgi:hypothetical protein
MSWLLLSLLGLLVEMLLIVALGFGVTSRYEAERVDGTGAGEQRVGSRGGRPTSRTSGAAVIAMATGSAAQPGGSSSGPGATTADSARTFR